MAGLSPPSGSLRVRLLLLILLTLLPSLLLALYTGAEQRSLAVAQAHAEALRLVRLAATHHDRSIETTRQLLATLAQLVQARQIDAGNCASLLAEVLGQHSIYANLGLIDRGGQLICSAVPVSGALDLSDRTYFQRTLSTGGFAAGDYQIGRITRQATVNFGYPVFDQAGQIEAVLFAALNLAFFQELAADVQLPAGSVLTVVDQSGTILARYPDAADWVGQALPETPIVSTVVSQQADGTAHTTGLDGVMRLYAFTPLRGALEAGYLYIGIPDETAFADANRLLAVNVGGVTLTGLLALAAAWAASGAFVLRPVAALLHSARRLAAGDLAARAGPAYRSGELGELARVFDDMAGSLQQREGERQRAEAEIRYQAARAEALVRVAARLNARHDLPEVLRLVCTEAARALNAEAALVALYEPRRAAFAPAADCGLPDGAAEAQGLIARALAEVYARRDERLVVIPDARRLIDGAEAGASPIRTLAAASLWREDDLVGALCLLSLGSPRGFSPDELGLLRGLADQAAQAITNARLFTETERHLRRLAALRSIDQSISASLDLRVTLTVFLEQTTAQLGVDAADVLLVNPYAHTLEYAAGRGFRTDALRHTRLRIGRGYAGRAALERRMIAIPNWDDEEPDFTRAPLLPEEGFRAYYGVPLIAKGQVEGVLELFHRAPLSPDPEWLDFLSILAGQAGIAIDNARLFENLQRSNRELVLAYDTTIEGWSRALDRRYDQDESHALRAQRVTDLTVQLAQALGTEPAELIHVRRGAVLHDIGNLRVPDRILLKRGPLTDAESQIVRQHPTYAYELLSPITFLRRALDIPYCHHERWDGSGYPRGLKGEQIPLPARAFAVVDVWDALRSERPFREPWSRERVHAYLDSQAGRQFDAGVVRVFLDQVLAGFDDAG